MAAILSRGRWVSIMIFWDKTDMRQSAHCLCCDAPWLADTDAWCLQWLFIFLLKNKWLCVRFPSWLMLTIHISWQAALTYNTMTLVQWSKLGECGEMAHNIVLNLMMYYKLNRAQNTVHMMTSMETFSALLAFCVGNSLITGEFPAHRPVTRSFDVFFDLRPSKRLSKQSCGWWFETLLRPLWRHSSDIFL